MTAPANPVGDLLEALAACLCAQITVDERPETCFCGVIPGDVAVANYGSNCEDRNGLAWVRLANLYPAAGVGDQSVTVGNCGADNGIEIEVGILRQMDAPEADGSPPTDAQLLATALGTYADAATMRRAIQCCSALSSKDYILGNWLPAGPLGLMVGGMWRITAVV